MTKASLLVNDKHNVDLILEPIKGGDIISVLSIKELVGSSEFQKLHFSESNVKNAIAELDDVLKPLQDKQTGREIRYQILERINASNTNHDRK